MTDAKRTTKRNHFVRTWGIVLALTALAAGGCTTTPRTPPPDATRFAQRVADIVARDEATPPAPGGIVFTGSSSIARWNLAATLPDITAANHGIGGAQIPDILYYGEELLLRARPRLVVFYCGTNDIAAGAGVEETIRRHDRFTRWLDRHLPRTHLLVIGLLPNHARWKLWPDMQRVNAHLAADAAAHPRRHFCDASAAMLGADGLPRDELLVADRLHLSPEGYAALVAVLRPQLDAVQAQLSRE